MSSAVTVFLRMQPKVLSCSDLPIDADMSACYALAVFNRGDVLRKWREELGLSQKAFANRCGIDKNTVTRAEGGESITTAKLEAILTGLGHSMRDLQEEVDRLQQPVRRPLPGPAVVQQDRIPPSITTTTPGQDGADRTFQALERLEKAVDRIGERLSAVENATTVILGRIGAMAEADASRRQAAAHRESERGTPPSHRGGRR